MDTAATKEGVLELVERRAESCRRDEAEATGVSSMVNTWAMSTITFLLGVFLATPSVIDPSWRTVIGLGMFLIAFQGFRLAVRRQSEPAAALARWTADRYDALLELHFRNAIQEKDFGECADVIKKSFASWHEKGSKARVREMKQKRGAAGSSRVSLSRITLQSDLLKFARGDIGGPWDYLG